MIENGLLSENAMASNERLKKLEFSPEYYLARMQSYCNTILQPRFNRQNRTWIFITTVKFQKSQVYQDEVNFFLQYFADKLAWKTFDIRQEEVLEEADEDGNNLILVQYTFHQII